MKSFNEIYEETRLKYTDCSENEIEIRAREKYIFENDKIKTNK